MRYREHQLNEIEKLNPIIGHRKTVKSWKNVYPNIYRHDGINYGTFTSILNGSIGKTRSEVYKSVSDKIRNLGGTTVRRLVRRYVAEKYENRYVDVYGDLFDKPYKSRNFGFLYFENDVLKRIKLPRYVSKYRRYKLKEEKLIGEDRELKPFYDSMDWLDHVFIYNTIRYKSFKRYDGGITKSLDVRVYGTRSEYLNYHINKIENKIYNSNSKQEQKELRRKLNKFKIIRTEYEKI